MCHFKCTRQKRISAEDDVRCEVEMTRPSQNEKRRCSKCINTLWRHPPGTNDFEVLGGIESSDCLLTRWGSGTHSLKLLLITSTRESHNVVVLVEQLRNWEVHLFPPVKTKRVEMKTRWRLQWKHDDCKCSTNETLALGSDPSAWQAGPSRPSPSHVLLGLLRCGGGRRQALGRLLHGVPEQPLGRLSWEHTERDRKSRLLRHLPQDHAGEN